MKLEINTKMEDTITRIEDLICCDVICSKCKEVTEIPKAKFDTRRQIKRKILQYAHDDVVKERKDILQLIAIIENLNVDTTPEFKELKDKCERTILNAKKAKHEAQQN